MLGVRNSVFIGGSLFSLSMLMAAYSIHVFSLTGLIISYGIISGLGTGLAYTPILQRLIEWMPDRKGLAGAIAVAGFGSGGVFFASIS